MKCKIYRYSYLKNKIIFKCNMKYNSPMMINMFCDNVENICLNDLNLSNMDNLFILNSCSISFLDYVKRIVKYCRFEEDDHLIIVYIYFVRLVKSEHLFNKQHIYKLFGVLSLIFIKMHYDIYYSMITYAQILGINFKELLCLEILVLNMLDYNLFVTFEEYSECAQNFFTSKKIEK